MSAPAGAQEPGAPDELAPAALMRVAAEQVGYDDWGDPAFTRPLRLLIDSVLGGEELSDSGRQVLRSTVLRHLRNRLELRAHVARQPDAARTPIREPLVITGLPRTGTTLLHSLLARDPRNRFLRLWEGLRPAPSESSQERDEAVRVGQAERWLGRFYAIAPDMRTIHPLSVDGPEECDALLQNAFASQHFDDMFDAEDYSRWFYEGRLECEYEDYALQLRVLSAAGPPHERWVLKSPGHLAHLEELQHVLPDVHIVHCHRDPAEAVPSYASLILNVRSPNTEHVSAPRIGAQALARCRAASQRALGARSPVRDSAFFDVPFPALVADPIMMVVRLYDWLGWGLGGVAEASMRRWLAENPRDRHGAHVYEAAEFGLDPGEIRRELADYLDRFGSLCASGTGATR